MIYGDKCQILDEVFVYCQIVVNAAMQAERSEKAGKSLWLLSAFSLQLDQET